VVVKQAWVAVEQLALAVLEQAPVQPALQGLAAK
jgi:hypothetical protein